MIHLTGADFPFQTSNAALAFSLYIGGIPFFDNETPLINTYTAEVLAGLGYKGTIESAALEAFADGRRGKVEYGFRHTLALGGAVIAFDLAAKSQATTDAGAEVMFAALQQKLQAGIASKEESLVAATCVILKRWRTELAGWQQRREYTAQLQRQTQKHYEAKALAEEKFLTAGFLPFAAVIMDGRKVFLDLFKRVQPLIQLHKGRPKGGLYALHHDYVKMPGWMYYTTSTENSTRRDLGVPTK